MRRLEMTEFDRMLDAILTGDGDAWRAAMQAMAKGAE